MLQNIEGRSRWWLDQDRIRLVLVLTAPTLEAVLSGPSRGTARKAAPAARAR
jgi:hypothetical protein